MSRLSSNANVFNTCLNILRKKGYDLSMYREDESTEMHECLWIAEKDDYDFLADNPIELLGLVGIYEHKQPTEDVPYWWAERGEDIWEELIDVAFPEADHD